MSLSTTLPRQPRTATTDRTTRILMADDNQNDHLLVLLAAEEVGLDAEFRFVDDGSALMSRLVDVASAADLPDVIIMDLPMPGMDGHRTLAELQAHPVLWQIPVVVFTSSTREADQVASFAKGACWADTKPNTFGGLTDFVRSLPERAASEPYSDASTDVAGDPTLGLLCGDIFAELEDDLPYGGFDA